MLEQEEPEPGEERDCICWKCWKTIKTMRDCEVEQCPMCHREGMKPFPDVDRLNKEPAKVYTCFCENCQEYLHFRNRKCRETVCPTCRLKLRQEKVEEEEELFQKQINEWKPAIQDKPMIYETSAGVAVTGWTTNENFHMHDFMINENGSGITIKTHPSGRNHKHEIVGYKILESLGHTHKLEGIRKNDS
jgi:hypothetical protein